MELTPRTGPDADGTGDGPVDTAPRPAGRAKSRLPAIALLVVVVLGAGFVLLQALGGATTFYRNVDEAVAQRQELGTKRFRLQGTVVRDTEERTPDGVSFMLTYNGVEIPVQHAGDPPEMFKPDEAVLLEGHFAGDDTETFDSDLMIVKHSNEYESENEERLKEADEGGRVPVAAAPSDGATTP